MYLCLKSAFDYGYGQSTALRISHTPFQVKKLPAYVDLLHVVARTSILTPRCAIARAKSESKCFRGALRPIGCVPLAGRPESSPSV